jgi:myo-inositol-1(or 4)-monophosphatase
MDLSADLALMTDAARTGGALIREAFGARVETWSKGAAGPVTEIDFAVNEAMEAILRPARPSYGWLSEESPDNAERLDRERAFIVDPLDGTQAFLDHEPECAVSIGLSVGGATAAGVVYNPITEEMFTAIVGEGAFCNGERLSVSDRDVLEGATLIGKDTWFKQAHWTPPWPPVTTVFKASLAYRLALVAAGRADGSVFLGYKHDWDIAGGAALVLAAGGLVTDPWGAPLRFNGTKPRNPGVVAAGARLHPLLCAQVFSTPHPKDWAVNRKAAAEDEAS